MKSKFTSVSRDASCSSYNDSRTIICSPVDVSSSHHLLYVSATEVHQPPPRRRPRLPEKLKHFAWPSMPGPESHVELHTRTKLQNLSRQTLSVPGQQREVNNHRALETRPKKGQHTCKSTVGRAATSVPQLRGIVVINSYLLSTCDTSVFSADGGARSITGAHPATQNQTHQTSVKGSQRAYARFSCTAQQPRMELPNDKNKAPARHGSRRRCRRLASAILTTTVGRCDSDSRMYPRFGVFVWYSGGSGKGNLSLDQVDSRRVRVRVPMARALPGRVPV